MENLQEYLNRGNITISEEELDRKISEAIENANKEEILWENPNKQSEFGAQTISWKSTEYNRVYLIYKNWKGDPDSSNNQTVTLYPGKSTNLLFNYYQRDSNRTVTYFSSKNSIKFYDTSSNGSTGNEYLIPLYVIGYKSTLNF